jgi:predicted metalloprotease with PDZ domain
MREAKDERMTSARLLRFFWCLALTATFFAVGPDVGLGECRWPVTGVGRLLTYTFDPTITATGTLLHVTLRFQGGPEGTEEIEVPSNWAGETIHAVTNLRALSSNTVIADGAVPGSKTVRYSPNQPVVLAYDLIKDWTGALQAPLQFHPVLMPEYFEINGDNGLVYPDLKAEAPATVDFDWQKLPADWALATSFATSAGAEDRCQAYSGPWSAVRDALFTAGDFRIHRFQIGARQAVLAVRGQWTFTDDEAITDIQKVVGFVRGFWHDDDFPYFLVTLKPYDTEKGSTDGSSFTNAFWLYLSRQDPLSTQLSTVAHEAFHAWNPTRMGSLPQHAEASIDWFKEGFTRYYGDLLVYRAGWMTLPTYIENTDLDLRHYPGSTDPYVRGRVIALWLDGEIRTESGDKSSLDNVMFDMVHEADKPLTQARILQTASRYLKPDARRELDQSVEQMASLEGLAGDALGPCAHLSIDLLPTFDLGLDFSASTAAHRLTGVRVDGPAFKAGLRDGERLTRWSVYFDQPDKRARFIVQTESGAQTIEYYPRGKTLMVPQYHLNQQAYTSNPEACRKQ